MTRSERRELSGMARLMPNRHERAYQIVSSVVAETRRFIPELLLGVLVFGFLFFLLPIMAAFIG